MIKFDESALQECLVLARKFGLSKNEVCDAFEASALTREDNLEGDLGPLYLMVGIIQIIYRFQPDASEILSICPSEINKNDLIVILFWANDLGYIFATDDGVLIATPKGLDWIRDLPFGIEPALEG